MDNGKFFGDISKNLLAKRSASSYCLASFKISTFEVFKNKFFGYFCINLSICLILKLNLPILLLASARPYRFESVGFSSYAEENDLNAFSGIFS